MLSQARGIKTGIYYHTHYLEPIKVLYRTLGLKTLSISMAGYVQNSREDFEQIVKVSWLIRQRKRRKSSHF